MLFRRYILLFLTLLSLSLQGQQYPVDIQVFATPPYPQSLRGYADTFEEKLQAHFLLKDLSTGGRPFVLRLSLENFQGQVIAQTPDYIAPYLLNLTPGVRRTLSNIDFKSLLKYENLYGINESTYNGLLPEGTYFLCLSLYDSATGRPVSNKGRAMLQVRRYAPPIPTMPQKGEVLTKKNAFQHIVFQWMPRDIAPFMQYEFTLKEVWDLSLVPEEAFMTGRLVYQTQTYAPALAYTNMMPILLENKRYVWQVRAFTNNPNNPNEPSYFKNNGNSETFYFDLVSHCEAPKFLTAISESTSAQLRWSAQAMMPNQEYPYKVMYRERGKSWKSQKVSMPNAKLTGLKRGRTYIYKVGVACGLNATHSSSVFGQESYMYSTEQEFTTTEQIDQKSQVQCGVKPQVHIKNTSPLQDNLYPNTTFTAGDFPVTVLNATGSNGVYSGEGFVKVPYLQDTKIKVSFTNIKLNTERQLIEGKLITTYDQTERNVVEIKNLGEVISDVKAIFRKKRLTKADKEALEKLKEQWDFYLKNSDEIGITQEDKKIFEEVRSQMFFVSTNKLTEQERKEITANAEKAERLYDKYKKGFTEQKENKELVSEYKEFVESITNEDVSILYVTISDSIPDKLKKYKISEGVPTEEGEYIGHIKIGGEINPTYYIWTGELWSKITKNKDGSYTAKVYSKIHKDITESVTWSANTSLEEIEKKFLKAKKGANFVEGFRELWPSFEIALSIGSIAPSGLHTKIAQRKNIFEIRKAQVVKTVTSKVISKLVEKLNLGKFVKKIGDYEVYEKGEVFYRAMRKTDLETLKSTGKLTASSETFTSPTLSYIKNVGYNGTIVKFQMKTGTIEKLVKIGVRNDSGEKMMLNFSKMNRVKKGWTTNNALFKTEGGNYNIEQVNIGLGKGKALEIFNENIINFEIIK